MVVTAARIAVVYVRRSIAYHGLKDALISGDVAWPQMDTKSSDSHRHSKTS